MDSGYLTHKNERESIGVPPKALSETQMKLLASQLVDPPEDVSPQELLHLLEERVPPGVDNASRVKVEFLGDIAWGKIQSPIVTKKHATTLLGTMIGGYNVPVLVSLLENENVAEEAEIALKSTILIFENFESVCTLAKSGNKRASRILDSWANAEWFTKRPALPDSLRIRTFRGPDEVNTDDLSPAGEAVSRPDIPLHAQAMIRAKDPTLVKRIKDMREEEYAKPDPAQICFISDDLGGGSSRKSATNSLVWWIGQDVPCVPNKRAGGVCMGTMIAPIFFTTFEDAGGIPIRFQNTPQLQHDHYYSIDLKKELVIDEETGNTVGGFSLQPITLGDEYRAGGRLFLSIGRSLTNKTREYLGMKDIDLFVDVPKVAHESGQSYTMAQKLLGMACDQPGVLPNEQVNVTMSTVMSQDTTGPMTVEEMKELACVSFEADFVFQSFCHTCAYPKPKDITMQSTLPPFFRDRGGVPLTTKDGICHTWANRFGVPNTVGTGGDSHTRFPLGMAIPAGSGLVAFAAETGFMPLDVPESARIHLTGKLLEGITLRDIVNAIPLRASQTDIRAAFNEEKGKLEKNAFSGKILEIDGDFCHTLTVEQAFELTNATAERSAHSAVFDLDLDQTIQYCKSNAALMKHILKQEGRDDKGLRKRVADLEKWLEKPYLVRADEDAEYAVNFELDVGTVERPVIACPHNPENVKELEDVAGTTIDEVFIGSCMTNIGHFRAAVAILRNSSLNVKCLWIVPPSRMDRAKLEDEGVLAEFRKLGVNVRIETPGCSLCMGNQARVSDGSTVFSTSTRNFKGRMGDPKSVDVYLGSAEIAAVCAKLGKIPTWEEYMSEYRAHVAPKREEIYNYLNFHTMPEVAW